MARFGQAVLTRVEGCATRPPSPTHRSPRDPPHLTQPPTQRYDDEVRFDFFCRAALEFLLQTGRQPDVLHCHDWQTAHLAKAYW